MNYSKPINWTSDEHDMRPSVRASRPTAPRSGLWRLFLGIFLFLLSLFLIALATGMNVESIGDAFSSPGEAVTYDAESGGVPASSARIRE